jgi:hypothetical protein
VQPFVTDHARFEGRWRDDEHRGGRLANSRLDLRPPILTTGHVHDILPDIVTQPLQALANFVSNRAPVRPRVREKDFAQTDIVFTFGAMSRSSSDGKRYAS